MSSRRSQPPSEATSARASAAPSNGASRSSASRPARSAAPPSSGRARPASSSSSSAAAAAAAAAASRGGGGGGGRGGGMDDGEDEAEDGGDEEDDAGEDEGDADEEGGLEDGGRSADEVVLVDDLTGDEDDVAARREREARFGIELGDEAAAFAEGEDVLAFFGDELYRARVLRVGSAGGKPSYLVHYARWSRRWDRWLPPHDLAKFNESALKQRQEFRERQRQLEAEAKGKRRHLATPKRRRPGADGADQAADEADKPEIQLVLPSALRQRLCADWENVSKHHRLVPLPAPHSVRRVLRAYVESKGKKPVADTALEDIVGGLQVFFDRSLASVLLYKWERPQLKELMAARKGAPFEPSEVYGADHLLRLFLKLPSFLANTSMSQAQAGLVTKHLIDMLRWLGKAQTVKTYFCAEYVEPDDVRAYEEAFRSLK